MRNLWADSALTFYILCIACKVGAQLCPYPCRCQRVLPRCPPGAPLVVDACGCCRVCAKQLGEYCTRLDVCDPHQHLFCDHSISYSGTRGICTYGGIGCIPRCSEDVRLPGPDCPYPKRVEIPGECCPQWICEKQDNGIFGNALAAFRPEVFNGGYPSSMLSNCPEQSSEWSACSRSCGIGVSTRISNKNHRCILETQSQLCIVRPCQLEHAKQAHMRRKICEPTTRAPQSIQFEYNSCISIKAYRPTYCGFCSDRRCCTPHKTRTELVEFKCKHGRIVKQQMMFIISCVCHYNCSHAYK
ncbi:CCN family member 2-like isoform X2 [Heterodontus francisci]|uniref:CCN family member 2-like isoform X2 n=1 Tax=Heterodontus francisci TaxID=7792 RepID=UPI00355BB50C